jgi:hypothetical protein
MLFVVYKWTVPFRYRCLLSSTSRRTLIYLLEFAHARRKCDSIFEESSTFRSNPLLAIKIDMFGRRIRKMYDLTGFQSKEKYFINLEKKK